MILISNEAKDYIEKVINASEKKIFRISVVEGGCSGLRYKFDLVNKHEKGDEKLVFDNLNFSIASNILLFIAGSTLNYRKTQTGSFLIFDHPNVNNKCSCGISFNAR